MQVTNACVGHITNLEVLDILTTNRSRNMESRKGMKHELRSALSIEEQVLKFLKNTNSPIRNIDISIAGELLTLLKEKYSSVNFSKTDRLQLLNSLPKAEVELYLNLDEATYTILKEKDLVDQLLEDIQNLSQSKVQPEEETTT